jgi:cell division protein FtsB
MLYVAFMVLCVISIVTTQLEISKAEEEREELMEDVIAAHDEVDEMKYDLERPIDDNYIIEFAREKLGLHLPGETIFHYDTRN